MKIDKRIKRNQEIVNHLHQLLIDICTNPELFSTDFYVEALKSQGGLSKINDKERDIEPTSINTLKRISASLFENGFDELDRIRIMAHESLTNFMQEGKSSNKITKTGLNKRVDELEIQLEQLQKAHLLSINILMEDMKTFKNILNNNSLDSIKHLSKEAISKLQSLSILSPLFLEIKNESNVVELKRHKL
jgi:hypothetical protein